MMRFAAVVIFCVATLVLCGAQPNKGPEVVVVYNSNVPESKKVAEHYASTRRIPEKQVIGLKLPAEETISRATFRKELEEPLLKRFISEKWFTFSTEERSTHPVISASIRYMVLCYGVPLRIAPDAELKEAEAEKLQPELRRNEAAVDAELALLPLARSRRLLAGPLPTTIFAQTNRAFLSPTNNILMVARLDGPSAAIARQLVNKAMQAETNGMWGRAYFDARGLTNGTYKAGDDSLRTAGAITRRFGYDTVVDEAPETFTSAFPLSHVAVYAGWYDEHVSGPFSLDAVEFMPGAFAYHLHSFSAETIRSTNSRWVGPLLAKGATATIGTVYEPYLAGTPYIPVLLERLIWNRFSFGEAAYVAQQALSWQTTVVGDPLYTPFLERPDVLHQRLEQSGSPFLEWSHARVINLNQATKSSTIQEMMAYLDQVPLAKTSAVLQEKLGDLHQENKRFSAAAFAYSTAAKLKPSPQQRVRLLLSAGELHMLLAREPEAYDAFVRLVNEAPDYPNLAHVYGRLVPLARTLGKTNDLQKFEAELKRLSAPPK